jgi:G3E family GTPase
MFIIQVAGFLGSGKTTLMIRLGKAIGAAGRKVVIIVNEVGEVGVDGDVLEANKLRTVEITEGCICCSLSGTLQSTLRTVKKELSPDVVLIEPTGLALPNRINQIVRTSMVEPEGSFTVVLVDSFRIGDLIEANGTFFLRQLEGSDLIGLNKVDIISDEDVKTAESRLQDLVPGAMIVRLSAKTGEGVDAVLASLRLP